ncbi:iron-containing redox enzyme family protein [Streptomyces sp. NPDC087901]|uniref:iron-containing redox enzyme family protein n=1 Tax=Streptomyces sp. NPDC087901 TaxID=3365818 RepID=UPI0038028276
MDPASEWDPALLEVRAALKRRFEAALRRDAPPGAGLTETFEAPLVELVRGTGVSHFLQESGTLNQLRAYAALPCHLKEADPHAWVLRPRQGGHGRSRVLRVRCLPACRAGRVHARLFADLVADLGLETSYGHYVDEGHAEVLALVNLMSLFGLHSRLRGAPAGHFAAVEITSSPSSRRPALAMRRAEAGPAAEHFYTEHVEADAVHEQTVRHDVVRGLLDEEPALEADVVSGIDATGRLEDRLAARLLSDWRGASPVHS